MSDRQKIIFALVCVPAACLMAFFVTTGILIFVGATVEHFTP